MSVESVIFNEIIMEQVLEAQDHDYDRFVLILLLLGWSPRDLAELLGISSQAIYAKRKKCKLRARQKLLGETA